MSIKRIFAGVTTVTCATMMLAGSFSPAFALTVDELQQQIADLQAQLLLYQEQLEDLSGETPATPASYEGIPDGFTFENALYFGMTSDEVKYLQIVLKTDIGAPTYPDSVGATGWFGPVSRSSVIAFQEKYADDVLASWGLTSGTGYVGQTTRTKLNELLSAGTTPEPPAPDASDLDNEADCTDVGYFWYDDTCHANTEPASSFEDEVDCDAAGYFWYDDVCNEAAEEVVVEGDLTVTLSDDNPIAASVPLNGQSIEFLRFDVIADADDVAVTSIKFTRTEAGSKNDFDNVWLEKDGTIVADGKTINSSNKVTLTLNETIERGTTVTYNLMGDLSATAGNIDAFQIADVDDIISDAGSIVDSFPISGNGMTISAYIVGTATFAAASADATVDIGDEQVVLGEFTIQASSSNNNDFTFKTIRLKESGSAALSDIENIALYDNSGNVLDDEPLIDGNYIGFGDVGYAIEDGDTKRFSVRADIISGDDADTIILKLNKNYELFVEENVGFGATASGAASLKTYTFNAGKFAITLDDSSPSNAEFAPDTKQVTGLIAKMNLAQDVEVDSLKVYLHSDTDVSNGSETDDEERIEADIEDVRLYINDTLIDSVDELYGSAGSDHSIATDEYYFDFISNFTMSDDDLLEVKFDIKSGADAGNIYKFTISNTNFTSPEYVASGESVATADKTGSATGKKVTITSGAITATRNDGYDNNTTFIAGETEADVLGFVLEAGNASKIKVSKLYFDTNASTAEDDYYESAKVFVDGSQLGETTDFSNGYAKFESLDYEIAAGYTKTFTLMLDISSSAATTSSRTFTLIAASSLFYDKEDNEVDLDGDEASAGLIITDNGSLVVAVDNSPSAELLIADTDNNTVGSWTFTAETDSIDLTDLYFANDYAGGSTAQNGTDARMSGLKLYVDGAQVGADKIMTAGIVHFNLGTTNAITVPKDGAETVELKVDFNPVTAETNTDKRLELVLYSLKANGTGGDLTTVSGLDDDVIDGGLYASTTYAECLAANEFAITRTKPVLSTNTGTSYVDSSLSNATRKIYAFNVSADDKYAVSFKKVVLSIAGTHDSVTIGTTSHDVSDLISATSSVVAQVNGDSKTITVTTDDTNDRLEIVFTDVQTVSAGGTAIVVITAPLTGFDTSSTGSDTLETNIVNLATTHIVAMTYANMEAETTSFVWTDNSGIYQDASSEVQWLSDYLVKDLDTAKVLLE